MQPGAPPPATGIAASAAADEHLSWRVPLWVGLAVLLASAAGGAALYRSARVSGLARAGDELTAVTALEVEALSGWREARLRDAAHLAGYRVVSAAAHEVLSERAGTSVAHAAFAMRNFLQYADLDQASLTSPGGDALLDVRRDGGRPLPVDASVVRLAAADPRGVAWLLEAQTAEHPRAQLEIAVALRTGAGPAFAVLVVQASLSRALQPLERWPVPGSRAENHLFYRSEGVLRTLAVTPGATGVDLGPVDGGSWETVARRASREPGRPFTAPGPRGAAYLCAARRVPETDWWLVSSVELNEVERPMRLAALRYGLLLAAALAAGGVVVGAWWRRRAAVQASLRRAERELATSRERVAVALAGTYHAWEWDVGAGRLTADAAWLTTLGRAEAPLTGTPAEILGTLVHPEDLGEVARRWEEHVAGRAPVFEAQHRLPGDTDRWALLRGRVIARDAAGSPRLAVGVFTEITTLHRLRAELEHAQRLASLGRLAAGVAHEINNPLSYVLSSVEQLADELPAVAPERTDLAEAAADAREGAVRVRDVVRSLRAFSRPPTEERARVDVLEELRAAMRLAQHEVRRRARVSAALGPLPPVLAGAHELGQVFLNLLVNAGQAFPEAPAARPEIAVRTTTDPAGWAVVEVEDNGAGIAPEVLPHIFEPFFTTKPFGSGTGLGLSIAHGIVAAAGGRIEVDSEVGRGTVFRVRLPPAPPEEVAAGGI